MIRAGSEGRCSQTRHDTSSSSLGASWTEGYATYQSKRRGRKEESAPDDKRGQAEYEQESAKGKQKNRAGMSVHRTGMD